MENYNPIYMLGYVYVNILAVEGNMQKEEKKTVDCIKCKSELFIRFSV